MASSVKLTLRQPPNVDFVHGFPGIPAGANRPHASVKGLVELRVGAGHPVKAKYIKVELRKIEIIPGGGSNGTYTDIVGAGPLSVWTAKDEWEPINTQDIPFNIRIPENVPPSVALENGGGIRYELAAEICLKAKSGLFRKSASPVRETTAPIVIDKHELHSTWPVYLKSDTREVEKEGFTLVVERHNTCYGPGDRVGVKVTIKSSSGSGIVRSYEMAIRETAVFRRGPASGTKGGASGPTVRSNFIGSDKLPVRVVIRPGLSDSVELKCTIPASHTTTTVVTAQHIEIVYSLAVRAQLEGGIELVIDNIPVMMSNWPRNVSEATVQKIGNAPHLSLDHPPSATTPEPAPQGRPASMAGSSSTVPNRQARPLRPHSIAERVGSNNVASATLPVNANSQQQQPNGGADELGQFTSPANLPATNGYGTNLNQSPQKPGFRPGQIGSYSTPAQIPEESEPASSVRGPGETSESSSGLNPSQPQSLSQSQSQPQPARQQTRYAVNGDDASFMSATQEKMMLQQSMGITDEGQASGSQGQPQTTTGADGQPMVGGRPLKGWLSAEQEKKKQQDQARRYQEAKKVANDIQSAAVASLQTNSAYDQTLNPQYPASATATVTSPSPGPPASVIGSPATQTKPMSPAPASERHWPTAEEEKHRRLFNEAQEQARRVQAEAVRTGNATPTVTSPPPQQHQALYPQQQQQQQQQNVISNVSYQSPRMNTPGLNPNPPVLAPSPEPYSQPQQQQQPPPQQQQNVVSSPPAMNVVRPGSSHANNAPPIQSTGQKFSAGASLYQSAMAAVGAPTPAARGGTPAQVSQYGGSTPSPPNAGPSVPAPGGTRAKPHLSAEEEKAQMRYLEAKRAVAKRQGNASGGSQTSTTSQVQTQAAPTAAAAAPVNDPMPYDVLYPSAPSSAAGSGSKMDNRVSSPPASAMYHQAPGTPPSAGSHARSMSANEDGYRRQLNPLDAIASLRNNVEGGSRPAPPPRRQTPSSPPPGANGPAGQGSYFRSPLAANAGLPAAYDAPPPVLSAEEEKARLAARYAQADTGGGGSSSSGFPGSPPPPSAGGAGGPPGYSNMSRPLDANEEKARLAAAYAAEDQAANQTPGYGAPPPAWQANPPPAMHSPPPQQQPAYGQQPQYGAMYTSPATMTSPLPSGSPAFGMAAPVATRPAMPAEFQSQGSNGSAAPGGGTPAPYQTPEGYYANQTGNGNGNGYGYAPYNNGNGNDLHVPYGSPESPSSGLRRDPSISQGKRRAMQGQDATEGGNEHEHAPPPPLAPKPPAAYIQETEAMSAPSSWDQPQDGMNGGPGSRKASFGLGQIRPVSPLDLSFDQQGMQQFERPPLPPKLPI